MDFKISCLLSLGCQIVKCLLDRSCHRSHTHDDVFGIRSAVVIKEVIISAGDLIDFRHAGFNDIREVLIVGIDSFSLLEICVRVLAGRAEDRLLGGK